MVVTSINSEFFDEKVNQLTKQGWRIVPKSLRVEVSYGEYRAFRSFGVVLEKIEEE